MTIGQAVTQETGWDRRRVGPTFVTGGMVASAHPLVTATGVDVLRRGGNAVDAAVAAALAAAVVMPEMCGLGGDLFAIVIDPSRSSPTAYLGSGVAPRGGSYEAMLAQSPGHLRMPYQGPLSIGVPGMVDGYATLLQAHGSRSFGDLAEAAIGYAEQGHPVTIGLADLIASQRDLLASFESSAAVLLPGGSPPAAGMLLKQVDLAATLRTIAADGPSAFYRGPLADRIASAVQALGGALSADDLTGHSTVAGEPIVTRYRDHTVWQTGLPSQGLIQLEALNILQSLVERVDGELGIHLQVEATKIAFADRLANAQDPLTGPTPVDRLLSNEWAARQAGLVGDQAMADIPVGDLRDGDTTYLCVADASGMMVSLIQSVSSAFGSGVIAGDTGVVLNNRVGRGFTLEPDHPNVYAPGKRTMHTLNCFAVADPDGAPVLVGGTPGGDGQPQWNLQLVSALVDQGLDVQAAIEAPRWTVWPGTDPMTRPNPFHLRIEDRAGEAVIDALAARGHDVRRMGDWGGGGCAQLISRDPQTGILAGGTDPREEGQVHGF